MKGSYQPNCAPGQPPGYASHAVGVANAASVVKYGGWIGAALGGGTSYKKVREVCAAGNIEAWEKIKYTKGGSFISGVAGGGATGVVMQWSAIALLSSTNVLDVVGKSGILKWQKGPVWTLSQMRRPYFFNQLSTSSEPCLAFHSFSVL